MLQFSAVLLALSPHVNTDTLISVIKLHSYNIR